MEEASAPVSIRRRCAAAVLPLHWREGACYPQAQWVGLMSREQRPGGDAGRAAVTTALARARALLDLSRPGAAARETARALALSPQDPAALQLHGLCLLRAGDLSGARSALRAAIAAQPEDA